MGGVQSSRPLVEHRCIEEPLGISSTFNGISSCAAPSAALTISEDNAAPQRMIDFVRNTTKGFPSFSELRESMRRRKIVKRQESNESLEMWALSKPKCNPNSEDIFMELEVPTPPTKEGETTESGFHTPLNHHDFNFSNENLFEYIDDDIGEDLYKSEETASLLSYHSDASDTSESPKNLSYDMRKDYYYL